MNALFNTLNALAQAQRMQPEFVRHESRMLAREVAADAVVSDAAIQRMREAIRKQEALLAEMEHYAKHVAGRAP